MVGAFRLFSKSFESMVAFQFDGMVSKTHECERIFRRKHCTTVYKLQHLTISEAN